MIPQADYAFTREEYVIAPIKREVVDGSVLHLAVKDAVDPEFPPLEATSRCGVSGYVYVRGGALAGRAVCRRCVRAVT